MAEAKEAATQATIITYGETIIKSLAPGETGTIRCTGKLMKQDIFVKAAAIATTQATTISYGGKVIEALVPGQTGAIRCKGKKLKNDIIVKAAELQDVPTIKLEEVKTVIVTSNGVVHVKPSAGYDAMKEVVVGVAVPGEIVEEYDGTVVFG